MWIGHLISMMAIMTMIQRNCVPHDPNVRDPTSHHGVYMVSVNHLAVSNKYMT
jgi:hypothetical protein